MRRLLPFGALVAVACSGGSEHGAQRAAADSASAAAVAAAAAVPAPPMASTSEREAELTGDGVAELVSVTTRGPRSDSLAVTLVVRDARSGAKLYQTSWPSAPYLEPYHGTPLTPIRRDSLVRASVDALLGDSAFVARGFLVDTASVEWDLKEHEWRRANGVADTLPLPSSGYDAVRTTRVDHARVLNVIRELSRQPVLKWYEGGESSVAIAWSPSERRFVRVLMCC